MTLRFGDAESRADSTCRRVRSCSSSRGTSVTTCPCCGRATFPGDRVASSLAPSASPSQPSAWLRGPVEDVPNALQHAAHALIQAGEEIARAVSPLTSAELWARPGGAASVGFHLRHIAGSTDRLLTYARGASLDQAQRDEMQREQGEPSPADDAATLMRCVRVRLAKALDVLRTTREEELHLPRPVGRAALPSTVMGLLYHVADHTQRHTGQIIVTARIVRNGL